jgi:hypothetical protein
VEPVRLNLRGDVIAMNQVAVGMALLTVIAAHVQAAPPATLEFAASLDGASETPPNDSPGTGAATVEIDTATRMLAIRIDLAGLTGRTTAAHMHCCTADPGSGMIGSAVTPVTLTGFPFGVTSGNYEQRFDLTNSSTYTLNFIANFGGGSTEGAEAALIAGIQAGKAYLDIHSTAFPAGEMRGFLAPAASRPG